MEDIMRDTKTKGDLAEQIVILEALKREIDVSIPIGDRLPYDLIFDVKGKLLRIQVKSAWFDNRRENYQVDTRMYKANRKNSYHKKYKTNDFDFACLAIIEKNIIYIMPSEVFTSYGSGIVLAEAKGRQRIPKSFEYREAWHLIS